MQEITYYQRYLRAIELQIISRRELIDTFRKIAGSQELSKTYWS